MIILDSYIAHVSTLQGPQGAPTLPGYARLPISTLTALQELLPTGTHLTPGWRVANVDQCLAKGLPSALFDCGKSSCCYTLFKIKASNITCIKR